MKLLAISTESSESSPAANGVSSTACEVCGRRVILARSLGGGTLPIDPDPDPVGEVVLSPAGLIVGPAGLTASRQPSAVVLGAQLRRDLDPSVPRYRNHLWSCPGRPPRQAGGHQSTRRARGTKRRQGERGEEAAVGDNSNGEPKDMGGAEVLAEAPVAGGADLPPADLSAPVAAPTATDERSAGCSYPDCGHEAPNRPALEEHCRQTHPRWCWVCAQTYGTGRDRAVHQEAAHGIPEPRRTQATRRRSRYPALVLPTDDAGSVPSPGNPDPELEAIHICSSALGTIGPAGRLRVLDYLAQRFVVDAGAPGCDRPETDPPA